MFITEAQYLREKASLSAANQSRCGSSSAHEEVNGDCLHERISFKVVYRSAICKSTVMRIPGKIQQEAVSKQTQPLAVFGSV